MWLIGRKEPWVIQDDFDDGQGREEEPHGTFRDGPVSLRLGPSRTEQSL